ncbi:MAG: hypothetical protein KAX55_12765 [Propionivibrio sp.]|nr:hypothetical protein [Propionivibrio sp.]
MKTAADISLSGAVFTMGATSSQLVQSPSENDTADLILIEASQKRSFVSATTEPTAYRTLNSEF